MKVRHDEGVANHIGPEPCVAVREDVDFAWKRNAIHVQAACSFHVDWDDACSATPHYDGVKKDGKEHAVIAICGMGPITYHAVDPSKPERREL